MARLYSGVRRYALTCFVCVRRHAGRILGITGAVLIVIFAFGCGISTKPHLTIGYIEWNENVANSTLAKTLAEDELGYDVDLVKSDLQPVIEDVSNGEADIFMDVWMPAHQAVII